MNHTITLFEHEICPLELPPAEIARLERVGDAIANDSIIRLIHRRGQPMIQATQYVGVLRLGHTTIQVLPKMYRSGVSNPHEQARDATANLLHLLAYADQVPLREQQAAELARRESDWFEILTALFATHSYAAWLRGPVRGYQQVESELPVLKGRWRISEQMRHPERGHTFAVAYDEFSVDTPLNRVFRFVVERLWRMTRSSTSRRILGELRLAMEEVSLPAVVTPADADPALLNRLSAPLLPLLNLARLFLEGGALQLTGGATASFAFLLDMNRLFEGFVAGFLLRHRAAVLPPALQGCRLAVQAQGATRYLARVEGRGVFRLEPDILFQAESAIPLIIDTKYKRLDPAQRNLGVSQNDVYQMYAYTQRYDCLRVVMIYPQTAALPTPVRRVFRLEGQAGTTISAVTLDLRVDLGAADGRRRLAEELQAICTEERTDE